MHADGGTHSFFFVVASSSVKIHSRVTGQLVSTLSLAATTSSHTTWSGRQVSESHTAAITGLALNPANALQLLTCSLDGTIKVWDYLDAVLLKTIDLGFPVSHMVAHASIKGSVYVALRKPKNEGVSGVGTVDPFNHSGRCNSIIQLVSLTTAAAKGRGATKPQSITRVGKARQTTAIGLSADGRYLVLIGKRKIHIARSEALQEGFTKVISDQQLTCLAFHPETSVFATGDSTGQVRLWYFLEDQAKNSQKNVKGVQVAPSVLMHWHSHAVSALAFTPNGANLLSGGEESVMVLWQLATQNREFVPRLGGAAIASIAVLEANQGREEEYVASLGDGSIAFVGAINLKANRTISQALIDSSRQLLGRDYTAKLSSFPLAVQPGSRHLVVSAGHPSSVQFLDVENDRLVSQLEVVPSNRVSRPDQIPLEPSRVERVCFSSSGDWMATTDVRPTGETSLKMWRWEARQKTYSLNSRIEEPHGRGKVTSIAFSPCVLGGGASTTLNSSPSPLLLTCGTDQQARTWRKVTQLVKGARKEEFWVARSAFDYRRLDIAHACWEPNGSLLALSHDDYVTIWEPLSNSLQQVIPVAGKGRAAVFAGKGGRYIVAISDRSVVVWDIVFGQVSWERAMAADDVMATEEDRFCLLAREKAATLVSTFTPWSSEPVGRNRLAFALRQVCKEGSSADNLRFYALTSNFEVVLAGTGMGEETVSAQQGHAAQSLRGVAVKRRTLYDELIGPRDSERQLPSEHMAVVAEKKAPNPLGELFDVPSHLLPPMSVLYEPLVQHLLPLRVETPSAEKVASNSQEGDDDESDADGDEEQRPSARKERSDGLRKVAEMDWSDLSALFATRARVSAANGSNGTAKPTASPRKSSSKKQSAAALSPATPKAAHRSSDTKKTPSPKHKASAPSSEGHRESTGRKRKNVDPFDVVI